MGAEEQQGLGGWNLVAVAGLVSRVGGSGVWRSGGLMDRDDGGCAEVVYGSLDCLCWSGAGVV